MVDQFEGQVDSRLILLCHAEFAAGGTAIDLGNHRCLSIGLSTFGDERCLVIGRSGNQLERALLSRNGNSVVLEAKPRCWWYRRFEPCAEQQRAAPAVPHGVDLAVESEAVRNLDV